VHYALSEEETVMEKCFFLDVTLMANFIILLLMQMFWSCLCHFGGGCI